MAHAHAARGYDGAIHSLGAVYQNGSSLLAGVHLWTDTGDMKLSNPSNDEQQVQPPIEPMPDARERLIDWLAQAIVRRLLAEDEERQAAERAAGDEGADV